MRYYWQNCLYNGVLFGCSYSKQKKKKKIDTPQKPYTDLSHLKHSLPALELDL